MFFVYSWELAAADDDNEDEEDDENDDEEEKDDKEEEEEDTKHKNASWTIRTTALGPGQARRERRRLEEKLQREQVPID